MFLDFLNETLCKMTAKTTADNECSICLPDVFITPAVVINKHKTLNPTRYKGPDRIPSRVLLELHMLLYISLAALFDNSIEKGSIPYYLKNAETTGIFKRARLIKQMTVQLVLQLLSESIRIHYYG